ncbi:hypothetical protein GCM10009716_15880 [Streptomyces sodiiphilus]|uniref:Hydrolytic protein n=1 Tax=Streptomyces sodiiphilus TaxID=226217 RepID=A0ABP5A8J1_9ACTN
MVVEPGGEAELTVRVLNSGDTVEEVRFEVAGPCADWATVEPESLSLYPGASASATLRLRPPREPSLAAGELPIGVRVVPTSDKSEVTVPEGTVTVLPFSEVTAELVPRSTHGAWRGRHEAAVDSRGNTPVTVRLSGQQSGEGARILVEPAELTIPPGETKFAKVAIKPAKRRWRGAPVTHPFQAVVAPQTPEGEPSPPPLVLDGSYQQQPILPSWLPRALIAALLAIALLVGLWFAVLRPTVESAAREAITPEALDEAERERERRDGGETGGPGGDGAGTDGVPAGEDPDGSGSGPGGGGDSSGTDPGAPGGPGGPAAPASARAEVQSRAGGGTETVTVYTVPGASVFHLTDIVVQNPQGDAGSLTLSSRGESLLSLALENFRDSDYHFVTPILVPAGGEITVTLNCREVGRPVGASTPSQCNEAVFISGLLVEEES